MTDEHREMLNMIVRDDRKLAESVVKLYRRAAALFDNHSTPTTPDIAQKRAVATDGGTVVICTELSTGVFLQLSTSPPVPNVNSQRLMSLGRFICSEVVDQLRGHQQLRTWL